MPAPTNPYEAPYEPPLTAEEALATAAREGLTLPRAVSQTGYRGVSHVTGKKVRGRVRGRGRGMVRVRVRVRVRSHVTGKKVRPFQAWLGFG